MNDATATAAPRAPARFLAATLERSELVWRLGVATLTAGVAAFLFIQLSAWPPHEDETLALFTGRGSVHDLIRTVLGERGGAPLHFLFAWVVAHSGGGLIGLRIVSAVFAIASVPLIALLVARLADRATALVATAIVAPSWMLLFHGVYGRMYSMFLFTATLSYLALLSALARRDRRGWILWALAMLACIATHPYGALVLGSQGVYVLYARRVRQALPAFVAVFVLAIPMWSSDRVLASRFDVSVGGGGAKLGGPASILQYLVNVSGDFTVGWLVPRALVLLLALAGLVLLVRWRRASAALAVCTVVTPFFFFLLTRVGSGIASPESRHLIFVLPFFAMVVALPIVRFARRTRWRIGLPLAAAAVLALGAGEVAWGMHKTDLLYSGEPSARAAAREAASTWLAATARPDDVLFGYDPLFLGAWEQNGSFSNTVVPRADTVLALRVLYRAHKPLGRGVWVLDASDTNNYDPRPTIPLLSPHPIGAFEARVFGPFLVIRSTRPTKTIREFLLQTQAVQFVGQRIYIGDADINLLTVERALGLRTLGGTGRR
ncbi:MAG: mannosyltransferase [Gaiellaceae bacterium]|nr:mannosyltransferase [Gaiellaceae bacterium]